MPEWLEAIRTEVPDNQLKEFREVLRYVGICWNNSGFHMFVEGFSIVRWFTALCAIDSSE